MNIILELLTIYGICFTFQHTKLLEKPRNWICDRSKFVESLLECSFCTGAWSGLLTYLLLYLSTSSFKWHYGVAYFFGGAAWCYFCDKVTDWFELNTNDNTPYNLD